MKIAQSLSGLALIRDQKFTFFLALSFSVLILVLDLVLVLSIPKIIKSLTGMDFSNPFENIDPVSAVACGIDHLSPVNWLGDQFPSNPVRAGYSGIWKRSSLINSKPDS